MPQWWTWQYANPFYWLFRLLVLIVAGLRWLFADAWSDAEFDHLDAVRIRHERKRRKREKEIH